MSHPHGSSCCLWLPYLRCGCHHSCDWNGQVGPRRGTTTGLWDGTASVSVDTKLTNAEHSMRPITRNTVKTLPFKNLFFLLKFFSKTLFFLKLFFPKPFFLEFFLKPFCKLLVLITFLKLFLVNFFKPC